MIRRFKSSDLEQVMDLWMKGNLSAHSFVDSKYWMSQKKTVSQMIPQSDVFVFVEAKKIYGFIGVVEGYVAGLFVDEEERSNGVGKALLDYAKRKENTLSLAVYKKNEGAKKFFLREGFNITNEQLDENTNEAEYSMMWAK